MADPKRCAGSSRRHPPGGTQTEAAMIRIRVEYDAYNRTFKLRDREFGSVLEDGVVYELVVHIRAEVLGEEDSLTSKGAPLVHA